MAADVETCRGWQRLDALYAWRWPWRWLLAAVVALGATALRLALLPLVGYATPYQLMFPTVLVVALALGTGPALVATAVGVALTETYLEPPYGELKLQADLARIAILLFNALFAGAMSEALRRSRRAAVAARALAEAEKRRWQGIVEGIAEEVWVGDAEGRISLINLPVTTGMGLEEFSGLTVAQLYERVDILTLDGRPRAQADAPLLRSLRGEVVRGEEIMRDRATGWTRYRHHSSAPLRDDAGVITGAVAIVRDITDAKRTEQALLQSEAQLRQWSETLERRVAERTAVIAEQSERLRALAAQLSRAEGRERTRLAKLAHDQLQQILVAAKLQVHLLEQRERDAMLKEVAADTLRLLDDALRAARSLTAELSPLVLQDLGLMAALKWLARWMGENQGFEVGVDLDSRAEPADESARLALFAAVRELLMNAARHSGVARATVTARLADGGVTIVVADEGRGFDPERAAWGGEGPGFGLLALRQRLELMGGHVSLDSAPGHGARITLVGPPAAATTAPDPAPRPVARAPRESDAAPCANRGDPTGQPAPNVGAAPCGAGPEP